MKSLSVKVKVCTIIVLLITMANCILGSALEVGAVQISTTSGNYGGYLSDEMKIPFNLTTGGNIDKLTIEATSASKTIIPENIANLYLTTGSAIKANPISLLNVNGKISGTIFVKASSDFISKKTSGSTYITLTAKTNKNQVASLKLKVTFKNKTLTYGKSLPLPKPTGKVAPKAAFIGYIYPIEDLATSSSSYNFATDNKPKNSVSVAGAKSSTGYMKTVKSSQDSKTTTPAAVKTSASSSESNENYLTTDAQKASAKTQLNILISLLLVITLTLLLYYLIKLKTTVKPSK